MMEENPLTADSILEILENGSYHLTNTFITTNDVIRKISEFSNFFSSTGRLALINADPQEAQELIFLFFTLKKNIKSAISELGKGYIKKVQTFLCPDCEETITVAPGTNIWDSLQNHEHFESLFSNFLAGNLQVLPLQSDSSDEMDPVPHNNIHNGNTSNEHTDSGIEQSEEQIEDSRTPKELPPGDNSFRFNFKLKYDPLVESVIYPDTFTSISKYDQCPFICVQKNSPYRAMCLLCCCDLLSNKRISKKQCLDHVLGNRHMRASANPVNVENVRNFHEVFWNLDVYLQAHQVYFLPNNSLSLLCKLCNALIPNRYVEEHIQGDYHKSLVLKMFYQKCLDFYLLDVQVGCYGIKVDITVEPPKKEKMERKREEKPERRQRNGSNPSTSKDEPEVEHNIIPSLTVSGKDNVKDILPHRLHPHAVYFVDCKSFINCTLCNLNMNSNTKCLMKHIGTAPHFQLADVKLRKYTFFCEICNMRFSDEIQWDKHFTVGPNRHSKISKIRVNNKLMEFECTTCNTVIYGDEVSLTRHRNKSSKRERKHEPKLPELVRDIFKSRDKLETYATRLAEEANNTVTCMQRTLDCCSRLEAVLKTSLEDCKAYPFGSRVSGLGNQESDLDLFLDTGDMYLGRKKQDSVSQCQIVKQVAGLLRKQKGEFEKIHEVATARTPIVKLKHIGTQLECDLSFKHGLSVENTKFLRLCLDIQPITQQFILVLKKWSESNKLSEHITTYALAILAIFYLQINGYLLSVKKIRELNPTPPAPVIDGWETINRSMPLQLMKNHVIPYEHTLHRLLKDFFAYYVDFNYPEDTVCPLLGYTIKRKLFEEPRCLPPEMESYVKQLKGPEPEQFRFMSPFCIQDPFDLSHNLTKACQNTTLATFKKLCQLSYQCLESL